MTPVIRFSERFNHGLGADASRNRLRMRVSGFDLVSSFLLAALVMLATLVMILFTIWLLGGNDQQRSDRVPTPMLVSSSSPSVGLLLEFEVPARVEVTDLASPTLANLVEAVEMVSQQVVAGLPSETVVSRESGESLIPGPGEDGPGTVPQSQRWELTFRASSQLVYARQLDFYGIELGAFGGGLSGLDQASRLAAGPLARHLRDPSLEQRLYFSWVRPSPLASYERQLLARAGIATAGRQILKFIPAELENGLAQIELEYARSHGVSSPAAIVKTVFRSEPEGAGYRFVVVSQRYKRGLPSLVIGAPKN